MIAKSLFLGILLIAGSSFAQTGSDITEIYCSIRDSGVSLNCQNVLKDGRKAMTADDIPLFIDQASISAYVTVKSRKGLERTFFIEPNSPEFKKLNEVKRAASISEVSKYKTDLFADIEKKMIKLSDELDSQSNQAQLIKYDSSIALEKFRRESRGMKTELEGFQKNRDKVCTSTPAFEQLSKVNSSLQTTLSNILFAFQTPGTCMSGFKVFKDRDGTVDVRQLDTVAAKFTENCKKN